METSLSLADVVQARTLHLALALALLLAALASTMVKTLQSRGLYGAHAVCTLKPKTAKQYHASVGEPMFTSTSAFLHGALSVPLALPCSLVDCPALRGMLLCNAYGLVEHRAKCPKCKAKGTLQCTIRKPSNTYRFKFVCCRGGHKNDHMEDSVILLVECNPI